MDDDWGDWIGRPRQATDRITPRLIAEYDAVLSQTRGPGPVPAGFHWCLAPEIFGPAELGRDGHPKTGLFLPNLPLPRRMWAGGSVTHQSALEIGDDVQRKSTISDVTFKQGRSGRLGFVTVDHVYSVRGTMRISDRQNIVYREDPDPDISPPQEPPGEDWDRIASWCLTPDPTLLFRYSAVTFNGHRIHYDAPYATGVEGYAGLVVHGPLQSSWMLNLAGMVFGRLPGHFDYRGLSPLIAGVPVCIEAKSAEGGALDLRVRRKTDGVVTMQGRARPEGSD